VKRGRGFGLPLNGQTVFGALLTTLFSSLFSEIFEDLSFLFFSSPKIPLSQKVSNLIRFKPVERREKNLIWANFIIKSLATKEIVTRKVYPNK